MPWRWSSRPASSTRAPRKTSPRLQFCRCSACWSSNSPAESRLARASTESSASPSRRPTSRWSSSPSASSTANGCSRSGGDSCVWIGPTGGFLIAFSAGGSSMRVSQLVTELNRRRVFRALVGYGIAAFAVLQIIEPVMHGLRWPDVVLSYVVVGLAVGFPLVVTLAWIFDVHAGRIERTEPAPDSGLRGTRLALILVGVGVLAAAPGLVWYFVWPGRARSVSEAQPASSIAVVPFVNMSSDKEN